MSFLKRQRKKRIIGQERKKRKSEGKKRERVCLLQIKNVSFVLFLINGFDNQPKKKKKGKHVVFLC
jgi:hypothetical protein